MKTVLYILLCCGIVGLCGVISVWLFEVIIGSDLPDWAKYLLLK